MSSPVHVLLDTNVVLDVLLQRQPWVKEAATIWQAVDEGRLVAHLPASALTDVYYVARRLADATKAREAVRICLAAFEFNTIDRITLEKAYDLSGPDFEDDVQIVSAAGLTAIVTRDADGFTESPTPVWSPVLCCQKLLE